MTREGIQKEIEHFLNKQKSRKPLSARFKVLSPLILKAHVFRKKYRNTRVPIARKKSSIVSGYITARHSSPLYRMLGSFDMRLQQQKVINLTRALESINGIAIHPGETFSFWELIGKPTKKRGYVDGMLLSRGQVLEGLGGGLCQLGNLLHFLFLHTPLTITERFHHSMDVFPDSNRTIPFASGATVMYNFIDLQVKNNTKHVFQLKLWLTDKQLKGHIITDGLLPTKYHVHEKEHLFILYDNHWYRRNQLWREISTEGIVQSDEYLYTTIAPVVYEVNDAYLDKHDYISMKF